MRRAIVVLVMLWTATASADPKFSLDPRIAFAVERDNLLQPSDEMAPSVVVTRASSVDAIAAASRGHDRLWRGVDIATLALSTVSLAVDWRQTRGAAVERWSGGARAEIGIATMFIGSQPSPGSVDRYFAVAALANIALWAVLPPRWRSVIPGAVIGIEATAIAGNLPRTHL